GSGAVGSARDVGADMNPVAAVRVKPAGRPEHYGVAAVETAVGVGRGIRPGTVGNPAVGLNLDDDGAHRPSGDGGAEQSMGGRDRVDLQFVGAHRSYLPL